MKRAALFLLLAGCGGIPPTPAAPATPTVTKLGVGGPRHPDPVTALAFSSDGKQLLSADAKGLLRVWDADRGRLLLETSVAPGASRLLLAPDVSRIAILRGGEHVEIHPLRPDVAARGISAGHAIRTAAFFPDASAIVTAGAGCRVECWDLSTGEARWMVDESLFPVHQVAVSPDGASVACVSGGKLSIRDARDGTPRFTVPGVLSNNVPFHFLPDGRLVVQSGVWNPATGRSETLSAESTRALYPAGAHPGHLIKGEVLQVAPDGRRFATSGASGVVRVFDVDGAGERFGRFPGGAADLAVSADGGLVAARGAEISQVRVWDSRRPTRGCSIPSRSYRGPLTFLDNGCLRIGDLSRPSLWGFSFPDEATLIAAENRAGRADPAPVPARRWLQTSYSGELTLTNKAGETATFKLAAGRRAAGITPPFTLTSDERHLLFENAAGHVVVFDLEARAPLRCLPLDPHPIRRLLAFPDPRRFAVGTAEGELLICDIETGVVSRPRKHAAAILALAISADGGTLVSSAADETLFIHRLPR